MREIAYDPENPACLTSLSCGPLGAAGGIAGTNAGDILRCYSMALIAVGQDSSAGGIAGLNELGGHIGRCANLSTHIDAPLGQTGRIAAAGGGAFEGNVSRALEAAEEGENQKDGRTLNELEFDAGDEMFIEGFEMADFGWDFSPAGPWTGLNWGCGLPILIWQAVAL